MTITYDDRSIMPDLSLMHPRQPWDGHCSTGDRGYNRKPNARRNQKTYPLPIRSQRNRTPRFRQTRSEGHCTNGNMRA